MIAIVAVDQNWGIGKNGKLLVSIPEDMRFFREKTQGKTVIMGRKTFDSVGLPLKNRENVVISRSMEDKEGIVVVHSIEEACKYVKEKNPDDVYVIGGGNIYQSMLPYCTKAYVTKIYDKFPSDTFFPDLDNDADWTVKTRSVLNVWKGIKYEFITYVRK